MKYNKPIFTHQSHIQNVSSNLPVSPILLMFSVISALDLLILATYPLYKCWELSFFFMWNLRLSCQSSTWRFELCSFMTLCSRWLLMLSTNLEISHPSIGRLWSVTFYGSGFEHTHIHTLLLCRGARGETFGVGSVWSRAISVLDHVQLFTSWREVRDLRLQFMSYSDSWIGRQLNICTMMDDCISAITANHACSRDTMMLFSCCICAHRVVFESV